MIHLKSGDKVYVKLDVAREAVPTYSYNFIKKELYEIIGSGEGGYIIYIPFFSYLKREFIIQKNHLNKYSIHKKFLDEKGCYIEDTHIASIYSKIDGCVCERCNEFFQYAEPNIDGGKFKCFLCRTYPYR